MARDLIGRKLPGSIVNVSSQASAAALRDHSVYCSTKAAVDGLTRVMALELGPHQVDRTWSGVNSLRDNRSNILDSSE